MANNTKLLTKSKYLLGLQCPKLLWIAINDKERIPKPDAIAQKKFDDGTFVGELATLWYSNGESLADEEFGENLDKTKELLKKKVPIFEAGFIIDGLYSRADILVPVGEEWDIIEVKSATKVKDINLHDVAFQKHVYEEAGLKINNCYLMHINNEYVRDGEIEPKNLRIHPGLRERYFASFLLRQAEAERPEEYDVLMADARENQTQVRRFLVVKGYREIATANIYEPIKKDVIFVKPNDKRYVLAA